MDNEFTYAISMMSGTSLDGIDACLVKISNSLSVEVIDTYSLDYPHDVKELIMACANNIANTSDICFLNFVVGELFAKCANELLNKSGISKDKIDFISSHGQTVFHIPEDRTIDNVVTKSTLQIGDISVISERTGILTIGDFRTKDIAAGGLGAPLVPFADEILFGKDKNRAIQNIGGISNVTVLSKDMDTFAFDNGPGNMLIDYFSNKLFSVPFDKEGELASLGNIDEEWLKILLSESYYSDVPPKTTGRELFSKEYAEKIFKFAPKNKYDVLATITNLTAKTIFDSYNNFILPKVSIDEIVLGGGGVYNKTLVRYLKDNFNGIIIKTHEDFRIQSKFKEAIAFALLGYHTFNRKPNNIPSCTGATKQVIMGKISY